MRFCISKLLAITLMGSLMCSPALRRGFEIAGGHDPDSIQLKAVMPVLEKR
jgi:hypothetical protein